MGQQSQRGAVIQYIAFLLTFMSQQLHGSCPSPRKSSLGCQAGKSPGHGGSKCSNPAQNVSCCSHCLFARACRNDCVTCTQVFELLDEDLFARACRHDCVMCTQVFELLDEDIRGGAGNTSAAPKIVERQWRQVYVDLSLADHSPMAADRAE